MPFIYDSDAQGGVRIPEGVPPPATTPAPTLGETVGAAAVRQNLPYSAYRFLRDRAFVPVDPNHNPLDVIAGTKYERENLDSFVNSNSEAETRAIMRHIDEEEGAARVLDRAGITGVVAQIGMGMADPTIFMPGAIGVKAGRAGWTAMRIAGGVAAGAAAQTAVQEAGLQAVQETRDATESVVNVGAATILGGILGAGAGFFVRGAERKALEQALDVDRQGWSGDLAAAPAPRAVGAAAADTRELKLKGFYLDKLPGLKQAMARISPTMRIWSSQFVTARRALADLAETSLRFEENTKGVATTQGPALDRSARLATLATRAKAGSTIDRLYAQYRFGQTGGYIVNQFAKVKGAVEGVRGVSEKMTPLEFREEIGRAMRRGDTSDIPEIQTAAQFLRKEVFEPWKDRAIKAGLLPEDVSPETATSYFTRVYNRQKIVAQRDVFEGRVADWLTSEQGNKAAIKERLSGLADRIDDLSDRAAKAEATPEKAADLTAELDGLMTKVEEQVTGWKGKSSWDAVRAIKARDEGAAPRAEGAPRLRSADKEVMKAVRRMLDADTDLSPGELRSRAGEITDRIIGGPDGRLSYDAPSGGPRVGFSGEGPKPRGPLAAREFMIPDEMIEPWLASDADDVVHSYLRTMVPDVLLTERFGDVDMSEAFRKLRDEHADMASKPMSEDARTRLAKDYDKVVSRLAAVRDRIRNVYALSGDQTMRNVARASAAARTYNMLTDLGGVTITSLSDTAGPIFLHGFSKVFGGAWRPFFKGVLKMSDGYAAAKAQYKAMGIAVETQLAARMNDAYSLSDVYRTASRAERMLSTTSDAYFMATLLGPWTDFGKTVTSVVSGNEILKGAAAVAKGTAKPKLIEKLAAAGIDVPMAGRIAKQFEKGGEINDGVYLPNTADWTDRKARDAFEAAVARDADIAVISPGQEKPLWMSRPLSAIIGQYKTFAAAATERYLIAGLQRSDAEALSGLMAGVAAGMVSYAIYQLSTGAKLSDNPADWIREGISRSGALGFLEEANTVGSKLTGGVVDMYRLGELVPGAKSKPLTKYASRSFWGEALGPTAGKIEGLVTASADIARGTWRASDTRALRRVIAFQNLVGIRKLFDAIEGRTNQLIGSEPKQ